METKAQRLPPTLVFVSRRQCGASRRMESLVAWIRVTRKKHLRVVDVDADRNPRLAHHLGVQKTPTLLVITDGVVVGKLEGRSTGRQIDALLEPHLREEQEMTANDERTNADDVGYGASGEGDHDEAPDQVQPEEREPASDEEAAQDDYANTDDRTS
jgi:thioredoxin-like negative regulator of GroEL